MRDPATGVTLVARYAAKSVKIVQVTRDDRHDNRASVSLRTPLLRLAPRRAPGWRSRIAPGSNDGPPSYSRTIFSESIPLQAFRVSTTSGASSTIRR